MNEAEEPVVLVTGAGRGIGRAIALSFAQRGARVAVLARSQTELDETLVAIREVGGDGLALAADVTDFDGVASAHEEVRERLGPVDVLVNNAGVGGAIGPLWELDPDDWQRTVQINLIGTFICTRVVLPSMVERHTGRIVNIASNAGAHRWPYLSPYAVSKAAVIKLTENLATETRREGISVFAVHPGTVHVGPTANLLQEHVPDGAPAAKVKAWFAEQIERGEDVTPATAAALVRELTSGRADALSGRYIDISEDLELLIESADQVRREEHNVLRVSRLPNQNDRR